MKSFSIALLLAASVALPLKIHAGVDMSTVSFGGLVVASIPCTCPPFGLLVSYAPFFFGSSVPGAGFLYLPPPPISIIYSWFNIGVPSTWNLGSATPGGTCNVLTPMPPPAPPTCVPWPAMGTIRQVGTSLPGGILGF